MRRARSKLTLSIDQELIRRAKRYAAKRAISVSRLVEQYLDFLSAKRKRGGKQDPPVLRMLRGAGLGVELEDYGRHVRQKYRSANRSAR